ncbi:MAG: DUF58 domain-containing protein [Deltaproteobacteria bacterium]|nr:DUF58 domain-containing protein [Deltaproteobacteria bacterium]
MTPVSPRQNGASSHAAGYLLQKPGLFFLLGTLLVAAWAGQIPIVMLSSLFLSAALLAKLWSRLSLAGVTFSRTLKEERLFPGESTEIRIRITNRKLLPLPWFQIEQELPLDLCEDMDPKGSSRPGHGLLRMEGSLLWYRTLQWSSRLTCNRRGYYTIGHLRFSSGDTFGLYSYSTDAPLSNQVIVYPRIFPLGKLQIPSLQPMGESRTLRRAFQDPTRTIGVRDYRYGDSLRHIHWKASARSRHLQVRVFEATTSFKVALFLSVESFYREKSLAEEDFELALSTAASVAHGVVNRGGPVGLFVNTRAADSGQAVSVAPGGSRDQLPLLLEMLARVTNSVIEPFERFLERERGRLPAGTTLVLLFGKPPESLSTMVAALKASGYRLLVLLVGDQRDVPAQEGITWVNIRSPHDFGPG